jgi:hypothetical protein
MVSLGSDYKLIASAEEMLGDVFGVWTTGGLLSSRPEQGKKRKVTVRSFAVRTWIFVP